MPNIESTDSAPAQQTAKLDARRWSSRASVQSTGRTQFKIKIKLKKVNYLSLNFRFNPLAKGHTHSLNQNLIVNHSISAFVVSFCLFWNFKGFSFNHRLTSATTNFLRKALFFKFALLHAALVNPWSFVVKQIRREFRTKFANFFKDKILVANIWRLIGFEFGLNSLNRYLFRSSLKVSAISQLLSKRSSKKRTHREVRKSSPIV